MTVSNKDKVMDIEKHEWACVNIKSAKDTSAEIFGIQIDRIKLKFEVPHSDLTLTRADFEAGAKHFGLLPMFLFEMSERLHTDP